MHKMQIKLRNRDWRLARPDSEKYHNMIVEVEIKCQYCSLSYNTSYLDVKKGEIPFSLNSELRLHLILTLHFLHKLCFFFWRFLNLISHLVSHTWYLSFSDT